MPARKPTYDDNTGRSIFSESILGGATSDPVLLPSVHQMDLGHKPSSVFCKPAGTARLEFTLSSRAAVEAATAIWVPWPNGDVTVTTTAGIHSPVTALRCVSVGGACDWGILI